MHKNYEAICTFTYRFQIYNIEFFNISEPFLVQFSKMNSNLCTTIKFLCFVLLIMFQQYKIYAEGIYDSPSFPTSTPELIDFEQGQLEGLFFETHDQSVDPESSNLIPKSELILFDIEHVITISNIRIDFHTQVHNHSFKSEYSILINAP